MVGICDAVAIGAVSLGRRRCPGPLLGLVFSACSGVVLQSVRVGVVVLGSLVLAVWVDLSFSSVRVLYPSLVVAGCLRMLLWTAVGRLPARSAVGNLDRGWRSRHPLYQCTVTLRIRAAT